MFSCPKSFCTTPLFPGYKAAAAVLDTTNKIGAPGTELCSAGEVAFWSGSPAQRTPKESTACKPCDKSSGTVAPRKGGPGV